MSTREKLIQAHASMLALADELQNISRACKIAGIARAATSTRSRTPSRSMAGTGSRRSPAGGPACRIRRHLRSSSRSWR